MLQISKEEYKKWKIEVIENGRHLWINRKDLEIESDVTNWAQIFDKFDPKKQKYRQELTPNAKYQRCRIFVRNDSVDRKWSKRFLKFKKKLRLDINVVTCDEQDIISTLQTAFEGEIILIQYWIENKRIDAYFSKYKLAVEVDEYNHEGKNSNYEENRQLIIERHGIAIIRTNPDAANFKMNRLINQIYGHISQSNKEKLEKEKEKKVNIKELEDEIKILRLQLANLNAQNNDDNDNDKK